MKIYFLTKFENAFSDLKNFLTRPIQSTINRPALKAPKKRYSQIVPTKKNLGAKTLKTAKNKKKAILDSQGMASFSGSGYNGKGSIDHSKIRSNKKRR